LTVFLDPFRNLGFVRERAVARVDDDGNPAIALRTKRDAVELALRPGGIAEDDLNRLAVGESAFLDLKDRIWNRRAFVIDIKTRGIGRMLAGEGFGIFFTRGLRA